MTILPNGCKCSALTVHPKNWNKKGAKTDTPWWITYRFYDGEGKSKQVQIKGMNHLSGKHSLRISVTRLMIIFIKIITGSGYSCKYSSTPDRGSGSCFD
jgi:hypothetical protein